MFQVLDNKLSATFKTLIVARKQIIYLNFNHLKHFFYLFTYFNVLTSYGGMQTYLMLLSRQVVTTLLPVPGEK